MRPVSAHFPGVALCLCRTVIRPQASIAFGMNKSDPDTQSPKIGERKEKYAGG